MVGRGRSFCGYLLLSLIFASSKAQADIGLLLHESIGSPWYMNKKVDTGFWAQGGHAAILVSDLCAETPTKLRKCNDNEVKGVVVSRYDGISAEDYDWLAVPYSWYFNGVETPEQAPLFANEVVYEKLAEKFFDKFLHLSVARLKEGELPPGRWRDTVAANFRRDIYSFNIKASFDVTQKILEPLNADENKSQFSFFLRSCADFAGDFFKNLFDDFGRTNSADTGLTSPKGVAQSVAKLGNRSPLYGYNVDRFDQLPGSYARSRNNLYAMENAIRNPKYAISLIHFQPVLQMGFGFLYGFVFRFNPEEEYQNHFSPLVSNLNYVRAAQSELYDKNLSELKHAQALDNTRAVVQIANNQTNLFREIDQTKDQIHIAREEAFGTSEDWSVLSDRVKDFAKESALPEDLFKRLKTEGQYAWEGNSLTVTWNSPHGIQKVVMAGEGVGTGDTELLRWIAIARLKYFVETRGNNRPKLQTAMDEFKRILEI